jgi:hypothetical protein
MMKIKKFDSFKQLVVQNLQCLIAVVLSDLSNLAA